MGTEGAASCTVMGAPAGACTVPSWPHWGHCTVTWGGGHGGHGGMGGQGPVMLVGGWDVGPVVATGCCDAGGLTTGPCVGDGLTGDVVTPEPMPPSGPVMGPWGSRTGSEVTVVVPPPYVGSWVTTGDSMGYS